ncbi:MAG: pyrroloquinoline quinone precursor peptide PqqA [Paracoccaceae bacterium]
MAWTAPKIEELSCGMEINMYFPAEDERARF